MTWTYLIFGVIIWYIGKMLWWIIQDRRESSRQNHGT